MHSQLENHATVRKQSLESHHLESLIAKGTSGRIKNLRVDTVDGKFIVYGHATTYHIWQLALAAVRHNRDRLGELGVELDIHICHNV